MIDKKYIILTAQVISMMFSPFHMPVLAFILLMLFSYMNMMQTVDKVLLVFVVYVFTIALPRLAIYVFRKLNGWSRFHLGYRVNRFVPYTLSIGCYASLLYLMWSLHWPHFTLGIIIAALLIQIVCALLNNIIKVSTHAAASGGVIGALAAFSLLFSFNPLPWLCIAIITSGLVGSARLVLRQHQLPDVIMGTVIGVLCGFFCIWLI